MDVTDSPVQPAKRLSAITIRQGLRSDQGSVEELVASERLNPNGIHAENFLLAADGERVIGAVQVRCHPDGARELGSLVVRPEYRGRGIAGNLIDALLAREVCSVFMITGSGGSRRYGRWGFVRAACRDIPKSIRINRAKGQVFGGIYALWHGRSPQRLVILHRVPPDHRPARKGHGVQLEPNAPLLRRDLLRLRGSGLLRDGLLRRCFRLRLGICPPYRFVITEAE